MTPLEIVTLAKKAGYNIRMLSEREFGEQMVKSVCKILRPPPLPKK
jgi:hypothetical protein